MVYRYIFNILFILIFLHIFSHKFSKYIHIYILLFFIFLLNYYDLFNKYISLGGLLENSLQFYDIKKYFKCDFTEEDNLIQKTFITLDKCLQKCLNDVSCTCLHYNPLKKECFFKQKNLNITLDNKLLVQDRNFTSYIKKNNIRNLNQNYIYITFVESPLAVKDGEKLNIINIFNNYIFINKDIKYSAKYSFILKNINTNNIIGNLLEIRPSTEYVLGYINLETQIEDFTNYRIQFDSVVMNEFYKNSIFKVYNPMNIYIYNGSKRITLSTHKFNLYVVNNKISENVTISSQTSNVNLFNNQKYYISYYNFNSDLSNIKHSNKIFSKNCSNKSCSNISAVWDYYFKKNNEGSPIFCNKKYSFKKDSITNKDCFINRIWKINYNNYNNTFDFKSIDNKLNNKILEITNETNEKTIKQFNLIIDHIIRIKDKPYSKVYYKIINKYTDYLFIDKEPTPPNLFNKFCYHYLKLNNIKMEHYKTSYPPHKLTHISSSTNTNDGKKVDDFRSCIEACEETNNPSECIYLNFIVNKPKEDTSNKSYKHAYIKSKVDNLPLITCNYYDKDINKTQEEEIKLHKHIDDNNSIHLQKFNYLCSKETRDKPIQKLLFNPSSYYNNPPNSILNVDHNENKNILWNIELTEFKYKKYTNKKYILNKIEPPKLKSDFYWTNLKKNIGDFGFGLSCKNYSELNLIPDATSLPKDKTLEINNLINSCSQNNCNFNLLRDKCNNDPLCTNFQISKDKRNCYLSHLNNIYLLEKDNNIDKNKKITTYYKQT
jgi:hypothetical protein